MGKLIKSTVFLFILFGTARCFGQDSTKTLFLKRIGWEINVPENFKLIDSSDNDKLMQKGVKAMEEVSKLEVDVSETITLFTLMNGSNYLSGTITPFDVKKDGSYAAANRQLREIVYKTFAEKAPGTKLDTVTTKTVIDGLPFEKFTLKITLNERPLLTMCIMYKLYKGYDLGISYLYLSDWAKTAIEKVINQSKFKR